MRLFKPVNFTRTDAGTLASLAGFLFWIYFVSTTRVWWIDSSYTLGLFQILPVSFWLSLALSLLGVWLTIDTSNERLFLIQALMLNLIIWGTPILVEPHVRQPDSWVDLGATKLILDSAHIPPPTDWNIGYLAARTQWPGSFIFGAMLLSVTGIPAEYFLGFASLLSSATFTVGYYSLLRNMLDPIFAKLGTVSVVFLNLWLNFYYGPQGFVIMLFPLLLLCANRPTLKFRLLTVLLVSTMIISHVVDVLFLLLVILASLALGTILGVRRQSVRLLALYVLLIAAVVAYNARLPYIQIPFQDLLKGPATVPSVQNIGTGVAQLIRYCAIATTLVIAAVHLAKTRKEKSRLIFYASWMGVSLFLVLLDYRQLGSFQYLSARGLGFLFLIIPVIIASFLQNSKFCGPINRRSARLCLAVAMLLLVISVSTLYYAENDWIMSDSTLAVAGFLTNHTGPQSVVGPLRLSTIFLYQTRIQPTPWVQAGVLKATYRDISKFNIIGYDEYTVTSSPRAGVFMALYANFSETHRTNLIYNNGICSLYRGV